MPPTPGYRGEWPLAPTHLAAIIEEGTASRGIEQIRDEATHDQ